MEKGQVIGLHKSMEIFQDNLEDIKQACMANIQDILSTTPKPVLSGDEDLDWVRKEVYKLRVEHAIKHYQMSYKTIVRQQQHLLTPRTKQGGVTDQMIERAKEYPIADLFTELVNYPIRGGMSKCPFHDDNTASFSLRKYNRYRCFGCEEKGSTIDLYMKLNGVNFIQAVKALQ